MSSALHKIVLSLSLTVMLGIQTGFSQDVHFSQFDAAPLYFNPALSGLMECNNRFISNFKGQWSTYNSFMLSYDRPLPAFSLAGGDFGLGALINADYAGETTYGNTMLKIMPAYHKEIIPGFFKLSTGLDVMFNHNSVDETKVVLPGQIDPNTGEAVVGTDFEKTSKLYSDLGLGINGEFRLQNDIPINAGITFHRLLGSGGGGFATTQAPSNYRRYSLNANAVYPINTTVSLLPSFIFLKQKKYNEMNAGTFVKFSLGEQTSLLDALYAGAWYRFGDALIFGLAFDKPINTKWTLNFGFSYDLTVSSFSESNKWKSTNNVGKDSFEISIKLINCKLPIILNPEGIINDPFR
ncbi:MAG TPA: PorP/SprF family type IX secretion system membrane protein [Bacteroidales bacterium]|nr:PorP/SprF family type IX secretion system membrane protein [Bacteroidales bacterium]